MWINKCIYRILLSADIEAVRNGQWPETRQLKVS